MPEFLAETSVGFILAASRDSDGVETYIYIYLYILVSIKFGHCSFEAAVAEWLMLWTGTNSTRVRIPAPCKHLQNMAT